MAIRYEWHEGGMNMSLEGDWVAHADYSAERADAQAEIATLRGALEGLTREYEGYFEGAPEPQSLITARAALK